MRNFFFGIKNSGASTSLGALLLRVGFGVLMIPQHGYAKLVGFSAYKDKFMDFLGLGSTVSLSLAIFAEFFCSILLVFGLFTRLATIPLLTTMLIAMGVHNWAFFGEYELATAYFIAYAAILWIGPGNYSIDYLLFKRKR